MLKRNLLLVAGYFCALFLMALPFATIEAVPEAQAIELASR